jgi:hypothetical protein
MSNGDSGAPAKMTPLARKPSGTAEDRRSEVAAFELWQRQCQLCFGGRPAGGPSVNLQRVTTPS